MFRAALAIAFWTVAVCAARSAPLGVATKSALAGEWNMRCDSHPGRYTFTLEFAVTGGSIALDNGTESPGSDSYAIASAESSSGLIRLRLADRDGRPSGGIVVRPRGPDKLEVRDAHDYFEGFGGRVYRRCRMPADRSALQLSAAQARAISTTLPP